MAIATNSVNKAVIVRLSV